MRIVHSGGVRVHRARVSDVDGAGSRGDSDVIDGISAFDSISRQEMVERLARVPGGSAVLPFVYLFTANLLHLWEDDAWTVPHNPST